MGSKAGFPPDRRASDNYPFFFAGLGFGVDNHAFAIIAAISVAYGSKRAYWHSAKGGLVKTAVTMFCAVLQNVFFKVGLIISKDSFSDALFVG